MKITKKPPIARAKKKLQIFNRNQIVSKFIIIEDVVNKTIIII